MTAPHWTQHLKGTPKKQGTMNKTEGRYAEQLEAHRLAGDVLWWRYEAITLRLTDPTEDGRQGTRYTPDFLVMRHDGTLECHEVKGYAAKSDINRLKLAADTFPFVFLLVTHERNGWTKERI